MVLQIFVLVYFALHLASHDISFSQETIAFLSIGAYDHYWNIVVFLCCYANINCFCAD